MPNSYDYAFPPSVACTPDGRMVTGDGMKPYEWRLFPGKIVRVETLTDAKGVEVEFTKYYYPR